MVLKDELAYKTLIMGLVDRRIISYDTAFKLLDFDPGYEKKQLKSELPDVVAGYYGLKGSPFQQTKGLQQQSQPNPQDNTQTNPQGTPPGTPSKGRPPNQPTNKTPTKPTPKGQTKEKLKKAAGIEFLKNLTLEEISEMKSWLDFTEQKKLEELANLVQKTETIREDIQDDESDK